MDLPKDARRYLPASVRDTATADLPDALVEAAIVRLDAAIVAGELRAETLQRLPPRHQERIRRTSRQFIPQSPDVDVRPVPGSPQRVGRI